MSDAKIVEKIVALKSQVERAFRETARLEATSEASERRLQEIETELRSSNGMDPGGDLEAQLSAEGRAIQQELRDVEEELRRIERASSGETEQPLAEGAV